ncbi:MAG: hypothetical protein ACLT98_08730 [Eggerthellaceae bacterium]
MRTCLRIDQGIARAKRIVDGAKENIDKLDPSDPEYDKKLAALQSWLAFGEQTLSELQGQKDALLSQQAQLDDAVAQLTAGIAQIDAQTAGVPEQLRCARRIGGAARCCRRAFATAQSHLTVQPLSSQAAARSLMRGNSRWRRALPSLKAARPNTLRVWSLTKRVGRNTTRRRRCRAQFADAETKLADAQAEIDALEAPASWCSTVRRTSERKASFPMRAYRPHRHGVPVHLHQGGGAGVADHHHAHG